MAYILLLSALNLLYCSSRENKMNPSTIYELVEKYEPRIEYEFYKKKQHYDIGDSLGILFKGLNPNKILHDSNFRKPLLLLLEKKYLYIANNAANKNVFYVNNANNWGGEINYIQFALNVFSKIPLKSEEDYYAYISKGKDVVCIDSIIAEVSSYQLINKEHKAIHESCVRNMPSGCLD